MSKTAKGCLFLTVVYALLTATSYVLLTGAVAPLGAWLRETPLAQAAIVGGALTLALVLWLAAQMGQAGHDPARLHGTTEGSVRDE